MLPDAAARKPGKAKEAPRVTVAHPAVRSLMDEDDYNGWLEAYKTVDVRARVRGHITKVHFKDGDMVKEGQTPLFDIDPAPFEAAADADRSPGQGAGSPGSCREERRGAESDLVKTNAVSQQELDKSQADANSFDGADRGKEGRSGSDPARPEIRQDHRRP